ncbi:MAG: endonuclease/exonuclease/phosphatase family protein [bacterium]
MDGGLDGIQEACVTSEVGTGTSYLYNCEYDTGILTSAPIVAQDSIALDSFLVAASVNYARVDTPVGQLDVFCTHLASNIPTFTYNGAHGSYKEEQAAQIGQLLAFIDEKNDGSVPVIVLGDLNTGPAIAGTNIEAEWDDHYQLLLDYGLTNPYAEQDDVAPTVSRDNTFLSDTSTEKLLDHALVRDYPGRTFGERTLMDTVHIDVDGQDVETHPSDHFGLILTLTPAPTCE